jgi:hypothetical protein
MMSPAASPVGAEPPRRAAAARLARFTPAAASEILGLSPGELDRWDRACAELRLAASLTFPDLLALAVVAEASRRLGAGAGDFSLGLCRLFEAMAAQADVERLDEHVALVGRDFARLARARDDHIRCTGDGFIVVALAPILAGLRGQVFP